MAYSLIHITVAYSNAVLVAVLPHISNFAEKLDLPIPTPIAAGQVARCNISPWEENVGCGVRLTNGYFFSFAMGAVQSFRSPINWFYNTNDDWSDAEYFKRYQGKDNMTTNEVIELARNSFEKLGYTPDDFNIRNSPTRIEGPFNSRRFGHLPYCRIEWDSPESKIRNLLRMDYSIQFDVDMQNKQIVGMNLSGRQFWQSNPKIAVIPDLETNYQSAGEIGRLAAMMNHEPYAKMTPAYSNETLTATLPHVTDFVSRLDLPVAKPVTGNQVLLFMPPLYTNINRCTVLLTNYFCFTLENSFVCIFDSPNDWFEEAGTKTNWATLGKNCMTENEAIEFARNSFRQLGYKPEDFHLNESPTVETATNSQNQLLAYCRVDWENSDDVEGTSENPPDIYQIQFDIDMKQKQIVGATLISRKFIPQSRSQQEFKKPVSFKMFVRTNAPIHLLN
jgi:hypothetical protein